MTFCGANVGLFSMAVIASAAQKTAFDPTATLRKICSGAGGSMIDRTGNK
jgi:hypothetical protein